jgi:glycosidase
MNSAIKMVNTDAFLLAEVYNPNLYREYIHKGKMDYLYDKVALYDTIKNIMQGHGWTDHIVGIQDYKADIEHNMLHFLENHDEQRIASPEFAGSAEKGKPAMVVSATISTSPTMIYFGQELGEPGAENAGFGSPSRTSIFDYVGVPTHQRWVNDKNFDGGQSTAEEKELRDFYKRLLNFTINSEALMGNYAEIQTYNRENVENYNRKVFSFVRWSENEKLIIVANFDDLANYDLDLQIPANIILAWELKDGIYKLQDQLYNKVTTELEVKDGVGFFNVELDTLTSYIFKVDI